MKVLYFALECKPFSKVGGVGDVALELPIALAEKGIDIKIVTPYYSVIKSDLIDDKPFYTYNISFKNKQGAEVLEEVELYSSKYKGVEIIFVKNKTYFEGEYGVPYVFSPHTPFYDDFIRFDFFSRTCLRIIENNSPDIIHVNDWGLGFLLGKLKQMNNTIKTVLTIHNNSYQGNMWIPAIRKWSAMDLYNNKQTKRLFVDPRRKWNSVNPLKLGVSCANAVNAVSPTYKNEILRKERAYRFFSGGNGIHWSLRKASIQGRLFGILNGFDYSDQKSYEETIKIKNEAKRELGKNFKDPDCFLIGFVGRAVEQKFKLLREEYKEKSILNHIADSSGVNIAILATGLPEYENFLETFKDYTNVFVTLAFDKDLAKKISLGCDLFLMPSLYEPCGITQMESLSSATPPLVRFTGGLKDTVRQYTEKNGTGFGFSGIFRESILKNLVKEVESAIQLYHSNPEGYDQIRRNGHNEKFLWEDAAVEYIKMYKKVLKKNG